MLRVFLPHLDGWNAARREAAARYEELGLGEVAELPPDEPGPRLPHVLRPLVRARPARRRARRRPRSGSPPTTSRRSTCSRRCATSATRKETCQRPRRRRARTSACRCGEGSPRSSRPRWSRCCDAPRASSEHDLDPGHPAPRLAARRRRRADRAAWWGAFFLCFDQSVPRYYQHFLSWQVYAVVIGIGLGAFVALRLLQPLVAVRVHAGHVGRLPRRHGRVPRHRPRALRLSARAHLAPAEAHRRARLPPAARLRRRARACSRAR